MELAQIISTILSGLISGLFTFLGVIFKNKHDRERDLKQKEELQFKERPQLAIDEFKGLHKYNENVEHDFDVIALMPQDNSAFTRYDRADFDINNWECVEYTFTNTGHTRINTIMIAKNCYEFTTIFKTDIFRTYTAEHKTLSKYCYNVDFETNIKPGDTFTLQICYTKHSYEYLNPLSLPLYDTYFWLIDDNGDKWKQELNSLNRIINISHLSKENEYKKCKAEATTLIKND
jgi:hypothetical protein